MDTVMLDSHAMNDRDRMLVAFPLVITTADGYRLHGHLWRHPVDRTATTRRPPHRPVVIINPATSVVARYYGRFAAFLFRHGFDVITYDYRGIGASRPGPPHGTLRGFQGSWLDWGYLDFDAVLSYADRHFPGQPIQVVAHSIGGFVIGLAANNHKIQRIFTMGAQFAHWRDYARTRRLHMLAKWHLFMPAVTRLLGYFPAKRLGWMEDTPAGVVHDWGTSRGALDDTCRRGSLSVPGVDRAALAEQFKAVTAPTLAVGLMDDEFGTIPALERLLSCYRSSPSHHLRIAPSLLGERSIGHFAFFHDRFAPSLWPLALEWLRDGTRPDRVPGFWVPRG